jgi:hypothetical protein
MDFDTSSNPVKKAIDSLVRLMAEAGTDSLCVGSA